jgi:hypothetical protein
VAYFHFTPQVLQDLRRLGLSPTLYGILLTVENAPFQQGLHPGDRGSVHAPAPSDSGPH